MLQVFLTALLRRDAALRCTSVPLHAGLSSSAPGYIPIGPSGSSCTPCSVCAYRTCYIQCRPYSGALTVNGAEMGMELR
eukprot:6190797-Pleurochrysis_carterae.AAC.3